jgi:uncharacterized protein YjgD (DUF1641 family)
MAKRLDYTVPAADPGEKTRHEAYAELDALVLSLHEHGVLRLLRDVSGSLSELALLVTRELNNERGYDALANFYVLARLAGRLPAKDFERVAEAMGDGFATLGRTPPGDEPYPPGLTGAYSLLKDEELWNALGPVLESVKAFATRLRASESEDASNTDAAGDKQTRPD